MKTNVLRWVLVPLATVGAFYAVLYFNLFVLMFGPFPKDLAGPTAGALMGMALVLVGSLIAPRHQAITALTLFFAVVLPAMLLLHLHVVGTIGGGLLAVAAIIWWFHSSRTMRQARWIYVVLILSVVAFVGLVYARFADRPALDKPLNDAVKIALGTNAARVTAFNEYDLGGFVDSQRLWRLKADTNTVAVLIDAWKLQQTNGAPNNFWNMPPHYWPASTPDGAEVFQSSGFDWNARGQDGIYYFLLHDKKQGAVFVWQKWNF